MFMGDVGSTTLGFTLGWLLILVAAEGTLAAAILLALYFVADATSTLLFRAARRERLHEAHRHHAYQRAVDRGLSHGFVAAATGLLGVVLVVLAGLALDRPALALALGLVVTGGFILWLRGYLLGSAG
jgi:UDP-N-acetylmuramyl pentapeptide phosphotransferase/UDP-N-acetylglucosamine-1-phosphate transferase